MLRVERKDNNYLPNAPKGCYWMVVVDQNKKTLVLSLITGDYLLPVASTLRREVIPTAFDREVLTAQLVVAAEDVLKTYNQLAVLESVAGKFYN